MSKKILYVAYVGERLRIIGFCLESSTLIWQESDYFGLHTWYLYLVYDKAEVFLSLFYLLLSSQRAANNSTRFAQFEHIQILFNHVQTISDRHIDSQLYQKTRNQSHSHVTRFISDSSKTHNTLQKWCRR